MIRVTVVQVIKNPKHYFLLAFILFWVCISTILIGWYSGQDTISYVGATNGLSWLVFALGMIGSAVLTYVFARGWFFKHVKARLLLKLTIYFTVISMIIDAIVPASNGLPLQIHTVFATVLAISLMATVLLLVGDKSLKKAPRLLAVTTLICMLAGNLIVRGVAGQVASALGFNILILLMTYRY